MGKEGISQREYQNFINEVVEKVIHQIESEEKQEDLVENAAEIVKNDPVFKSKILSYIFSDPDLKHELKNAIIDDMCD